MNGTPEIIHLNVVDTDVRMVIIGMNGVILSKKRVKHGMSPRKKLPSFLNGKNAIQLFRRKQQQQRIIRLLTRFCTVSRTALSNFGGSLRAFLARLCHVKTGVIFQERMSMQFQTKPDICEYMISLLPEWVHTVLEPTPGEGNIVNALSGYRVTAPSDFWKVSQNARFDAVVMNPPFTPMRVGYDILFRCMNLSNGVIIALMPWLTIINSQKRTSDIRSYGLKSVTHLPRNIFPGSRVQTCILEMQRGYHGDMGFRVWEDNKKLQADQNRAE